MNMIAGKSIGAVIPAHNEAEAIARVVNALQGLNVDGQPLIDQIVVCNNASTDKTAERACLAGADVVDEARPGYGYACLAGISRLSLVDIVLFVDGDHSVDYAGILPLLEAMNDGADLCIGSRSLAKNEQGALTPQQIAGNKLATWMINQLWGAQITDLGPLRAIRRRALRQLDMQDVTFGWTVEMQVKAIAYGMDMREVPAASKRRIGQSKISGTFKGTILASYGIISTILKLYWQCRHYSPSVKSAKPAGPVDS